jgi:cell division protein FtsQ
MSDHSYVPEELIAAEPAVGPRLEKLFKGLILVAVILVTAELIWFFVVRPCMPLSRKEVSGFQGLDRSVILAQAGIDLRSSYMSVNPRAVEKALAGLPQIEAVQVVKTFPSSVEIILTGRKPLGVSFAQSGGRQVLVVFDRQGVVFRIASPGDPDTASLPLITGLQFREPRLGSRPAPEPFYESLLDRFAQIRSAAPELFQAISEIRINRRVFEEADGKTFGTFDLTLYLMHRPVRIRTGPDLDEAGLRYMLLTVDALVSQEPRIVEVDFRAGIASYTLKEASSG